MTLHCGGNSSSPRGRPPKLTFTSLRMCHCTADVIYITRLLFQNLASQKARPSLFLLRDKLSKELVFYGTGNTSRSKASQKYCTRRKACSFIAILFYNIYYLYYVIRRTQLSFGNKNFTNQLSNRKPPV